MFTNSVWSDVSGSGGQAGGNAVNQNRDIMLRKAYGSQLDLAGKWEKTPFASREVYFEMTCGSRCSAWGRGGRV